MALPPDAPVPAANGWKGGPTSSLRGIGALQRNFRSFGNHFCDRGRVAVGGSRFIANQRELLARGLGLALPVPHARIEAPPRQQLVMGTALDDGALIEHDDLIRTDDGGETVRDDERRAVLRDSIEGILNLFLGV